MPKNIWVIEVNHLESENHLDYDFVARYDRFYRLGYHTCVLPDGARQFPTRLIARNFARLWKDTHKNYKTKVVKYVDN